MRSGDFFLLDPDNGAFAAGTRRGLPAGGHGCILLFMSIFLLAGLFIAGDVVRQWTRFVVLSSSNAETTGRVLGRRIESDEGATYYVTYRFVAGGRAHIVEESVEKGTYRSVREGDKLAVRYLRKDPATATIEPGRAGGLLLLTGFCLAWNGFVFPISWLLAREVYKRHRLGRGGQRVEGELVDCAGRRDDDGDLVLDVRYRFRSPHSRLWIEGKGSQLRKDLEGKPVPPSGTPVHVLFLDDKTHLVL